MTDPIIISLCLVAFLTLFCQWISWRLKIPAILLLLILGIVIGPILGWFNPDKIFGKLFDPMVSLAVAVILFEGGLTLKRKEFKDFQHIVRNFITIGFLSTVIMTLLIVHLIFNLPWGLATLIGVISAVTGPTVITPMLRAVRPTAEVATILRWEGIIIDPLGAIFSILVFEFITTYKADMLLWHFTFEFIGLIATGVILGVLAGALFGHALRRHWLPDFLHNISTFCLVLVVYGLADSIFEGSGFLAATIMGIVLTNMKDVPVEEILGFKESISILLISGLFIIISAHISLVYLKGIILSGLLVCILLQFVVRPIAVYLSTLRSGLSWGKRALLAWIAPRGIVAAAVAAIFGIRLANYGTHSAKIIFPLVFLIIIFTVVFQSLTAKLFARFIGESQPEGKGYLIVGANPVALAIAKALEQSGFDVQLTTRSWDFAHEARMQNLPVFYGSAVSEKADWQLELFDIDTLLAVVPDTHFNALSCLRYKREFGSANVYMVQTDTKSEADDVISSAEQPGKYLFKQGVTFAKLASLIATGGKIKETLLTDTFDIDKYYSEYDGKVIPLFAVDPKGKLYIYTSDAQEIKPETEWTIIGLTYLDQQ